MIREEVIVHTEKIERQGQTKYFQVALPRDTGRIIGIECSAIREASGATSSGMLFLFGTAALVDPVADIDPLFHIKVAETIGRLTLYSPDTADVFFQEDVRQKDISSGYADFSQYPAVFGQWSHNSKRYETGISVKNCSALIEGHFKDTWGALYNYHVIYYLNIYIWIEKLQNQ